MAKSGWKGSGIKVRPWPLALSLVVGLALAEDPVIRVDVRLVRMLATVKDATGALVGTLDKHDFAILDNDSPQDISIFERRTEQALSIAFLVDCSGSTAKDLKFEIDSVSHFLRTLFKEGNPEDAVSLYSFNYQVIKQSPYTHSPGQLDRALRSLRGEAGTSLYDAIYLASGELERRQGRKVMVIVTDGGDTTSAKDYRAALDAAQSADSVIYPILVVPIPNDAGRNIGGEHALTSLAKGTGGRVFEPTLGASLDKAFSDILQVLRTQYLLAYYPRNVQLTKDRFHRLEVRVMRPGLQILSRNGYYGEASK
jgi:Ca-activated chloride channel family protein